MTRVAIVTVRSLLTLLQGRVGRVSELGLLVSFFPVTAVRLLTMTGL